MPKQIKERWPDTEVMEVISSNWYFWAAQPLWEKYGKEHGFKVEITPVEGTGGLRTRAMYAAYARVICASQLRASQFIGLGAFIEKKLTAMQSSRKESFKMNGCR